MTLKDLLTEKVENAEGHVKKLEGAMHSFKETALHTMEALGISFAFFKGWEFAKEGMEAMHQLHEAEAQVKAGLESTGYAAGISFEEMEELAKSSAAQFEYTRAQIFGLQSILVTFPRITKENFGEAQQTIIDMSTRMHQDLQSTAIQVGKALQDPIRGITALRRVGVNFNDTQMETIKHLVATGQAAKAQAMVLHELQTEFGGSAKAAADVDPLFRFHKLMAGIKLEVGGLAIKLLHALTPALEWVVGAVKTAVEWMKEHKDVMIALGATVGTIVAGFTIYRVVASASTIATTVWTAAQWLLNAALTANPIGIVIVAVGALVGWVVYAYQHFGAWRAVLTGLWEFMKAFFNWVAIVPIKVLWGLGEMIHGALTFDLARIKTGFNDVKAAFKEGAMDLATSFKKGYDEGMSSFNADHAPKAHETLIKKGVKTTPTTDTTHIKAPKGNSSGTKNIKIDIKINQLIGKYENHVVTVKGSLDNLKDKVSEVLMSVINDSQIVAGS